MNELEEAGKDFIGKSNVFKLYHPGFAEFYHGQFAGIRNTAKRILEIGVMKGHSLYMWRNYFTEATIFGIDIRKETMLNGQPRIVTEVVDQSNRKQLTAFAVKNGPFDIIIDDGSHRWAHQQISLGALFAHVIPGGTYVVEDLHTSWMPMYQRGAKVKTYMLLSEILHGGNNWLGAMTVAERDCLRQQAESLTLYGRPKSLTSVIKKRK